jgi:hypothetical protein
MMQEYQSHLFVITALHPDDDRHSVEIFKDMETFEYLSIKPSLRTNYRDRVVMGHSKSEAVQRAKDYLSGQLELEVFSDE